MTDLGDRIHLFGLVFEGRHGHFAAERAQVRPFKVDLTAWVPLDLPAHSDRLADTLDYNLLAEAVVRVGREESFHLLERLAGAMVDDLLARFPLEAVQVTVHKASPDVAGTPSSAAVTLVRRRGVDPNGETG